MKKSILFVCLGNICRSPAAEGVMRHMAAKAGVSEMIEIDSAGTYSGHVGDLPDVRMRRAASQRGYELLHRARQIREEDFERFDMIIVMDNGKIDGIGTSEELLKTNAIYREVYESQVKGGNDNE